MSSHHVRTRSHRSLTRFGVILGAASAVVLASTATAFAAQPPVLLGTAGSFAVLAGSGITNTGPTTVTGDLGTFPTPTETGMGSVTLNGTNHGGDAVTQGAKNDLQSAYTDAGGRTPVTNVPVELGGSTLLPGVYASPTLGLTGTLTLDAQGNPNAGFIFQAGSTVITASNSRVLLINGAQACNVVWQVGSSATFGTGTDFVGDVLSHTSITAKTGATFHGRLLASDGAVTLDTNTITASTCSAATPPTATATPTPTGAATPSASPAPSGTATSSSTGQPSPSPIATTAAGGLGGTGGPGGLSGGTGSGQSGGTAPGGSNGSSDSGGQAGTSGGSNGNGATSTTRGTLTTVRSAPLPFTGVALIPVTTLGVTLLIMGVGLSLCGRAPHSSSRYQA